MTNTIPAIAAVRFSGGDPIDALLADAAARLQSQNIVVEGFVQLERDLSENCCAAMHLEDIRNGAVWLISQELGQGSSGCRLDPHALADLCGPLLERVREKPDLLILNRFGKGEMLGGGFRAAIEEAFMLGIPVLVAVRDEYAQAWQDFTEGCHTELQPDPARIDAWLATHVVRKDARNAA
ncbi:DUF2478 domain-containing protein [Nitratireductor aquimarinus]|uniref:DUF2478 domain-containing protein n=1 Tax=Nitratireductor aquimarinus TaxID=889300 RepID=A0ABU4AKN2_9HYPH|nr:MULTISPECIES: DUF2478 domain-containing protein [Alphaproteobacteria]MBY6021159.1 DUF2478 domain-containing protein [Nitratireductor sp. DP7N14-4]MBN7756373.1 DUF2478 domain-containing protein [Nitratireductor aquimarinus]MBN7759957.1 DUF2478 domain-containing protein [Nitratireductor aquibiodomus]MBN7776772.1 DUF2478 domain-containing protein [Nitratireductor pacificus]MBN7780106.1 DUF2478 domain-containing protein [Nitratireductor pacificus]